MPPASSVGCGTAQTTRNAVYIRCVHNMRGVIVIDVRFVSLLSISLYVPSEGDHKGRPYK